MTGLGWAIIAVAAPVLVGVAAVFLGRLLHLNWRHIDDREQPIPGASDAIALTKPAAPARPPAPGRGPLRTVVKTWQCGCHEVWRGPGDIIHFPCDQHMDAELKDLTR